MRRQERLGVHGPKYEGYQVEQARRCQGGRVGHARVDPVRARLGAAAGPRDEERHRAGVALSHQVPEQVTSSVADRRSTKDQS